MQWFSLQNSPINAHHIVDAPGENNNDSNNCHHLEEWFVLDLILSLIPLTWTFCFILLSTLEAGKHTNPSLHPILGKLLFVIPNHLKMVLPLDRVPLTEARTLVCRRPAVQCQQKGGRAAWRDLNWSPQPWYVFSAQHEEWWSRNLMNPWGQQMRKYLHKRLL